MPGRAASVPPPRHGGYKVLSGRLALASAAQRRCCRCLTLPVGMDGVLKGIYGIWGAKKRNRSQKHDLPLAASPGFCCDLQGSGAFWLLVAGKRVILADQRLRSVPQAKAVALT